MPYRDVDPHEVKTRRTQGEELLLLDVREPDEVVEWAYPDALNIPIGELAGRTGELPTDRVIVLACHAGGRSSRAAQALSAAGWNVENLRGGQIAWAAEDAAGTGT